MTDRQEPNTPEPMQAVFCAPSRYVQGANATSELGSVLSAMGLTGPALAVGETAHNEPFTVNASMILDGIRGADSLTRSIS